MRGFVAVFEREVYERRLLGLVALLLGLAAVALPWVPVFRPDGVSVEELRNGMALGFAIALATLMALFLGGSIIVSDLAERRLGFYFARPLSGGSIWAGKMAAAVALTLAAGLLVLAPAALVGGGLNVSGVWSYGPWNLTGAAVAPLALLTLLFLLVAAHAASVVVRARSPWVAVDIAALALVFGLVEWSMRRLAQGGVLFRWVDWARGGLISEIGVNVWILLGFFLAGFLALAVAGAAQVVRGRTDLQRGHRALSTALWGSLLTAALLVAGVTSWVLAAGPNDLRDLDRLVAAPEGRWIAFTGPALRRPGYHPGFLYDLDSGRFVRTRLGSAPGYYGQLDPLVRFSADGRRAVWLEADGPAAGAPTVLYWMDLGRPGARPVRSTSTFPSYPASLALSPDGRRLAYYTWGSRDLASRVTVQETESGRLLASVRYEAAGGLPRLVFLPSGRLRIYETWMYGRPGFPREMQDSPTNILELDPSSPSPRIETTGHMPVGRFPGWSLDPAAGRALLRNKDGLRLCDARTGEVLAAQIGDRRAFGYFLADGRIAVVDRPQGTRVLRLLSPDGRSELRRFDFPGAASAVPAGQPSPGLLRVVTAPPGSPRARWDLRLLDLGTGASRSLGARKLAYSGLAYLGDDRYIRAAAPLDRVDGVIWFDPESFEEQVALKGS